MNKLKESLKKWWGLMFVPVGIFVMGLLFPRSKSQAKEDIKEAKKEVEEEKKEVEEVKAKVDETLEVGKDKEEVLEATLEEVKEHVEEQKSEVAKQNAKLEEFLPGLKK